LPSKRHLGRIFGGLKRLLVIKSIFLLDLSGKLYKFGKKIIAVGKFDDYYKKFDYKD